MKMGEIILAFFVAIISISAQADLVYYYTLDEGSGTTASSSVNQSSDSDLTLSSAGWDSGLYGSAVKFSTNSGVADAGDPQSWVMSGDFTLACWVNISGGGGASPMLVGTDSDTAHGWKQHYMIRMIASSRVPRLFIRDKDGDTLDLASPSAVPLNTWTHLAITFDYSTSEGILYVNGTEVNRGSGFTGDGFSGWDASTIVKAGIGNGGYSMHGLYDDIRLYDETLDANAVSALASRKEVVVTESDDSTQVAEGGVGGNPASDTFSVALSKQPSDNVTVTLSEQAGDNNDLLISPDVLEFTSENWTSKIVTVTAVDDSEIEGDPEDSGIEFSVSSSDPSYDNIAVSPVIASVIENDCGAWGYQPGDANQDCYVDQIDILEFASDWLDVPAGETDLNDDGVVDLFDLQRMALAWLYCTFPNNPDCGRPFYPPSDTPNIILFLVDDMGWQDTSEPLHTEVTGFNQRYHTPNMELLADAGMKFTQAYACAVCSPTRISLLTGMNAARHRVTNWTLHKNASNDGSSSVLQFPDWNVNGLSPVAGIERTVHAKPLPEYLREAGYRTIFAGKAHFGAIDTPGENPLNLGFDVNIAGHAAGGPGSYLGTENFGNSSPGEYTKPWGVPGLEEYHGQDIFLSEAITLEANKAIDEAIAMGKPFFLDMSHYAVHVPFKVDDRFYQKYRDAGVDHTESMYAALVEGMDKSLGDIMDNLKRLNIEENTIILFMSDNGGLSYGARGTTPDGTGAHTHNKPLSSGKGSAHEGGVRVPMIVYWPGVTTAGSVCTDYVMIEDFFPTILEMAGVTQYQQIGGVIDGVSFVPHLNGESGDSDRAIVWHYPNDWGPSGPGIGTYSSIRKGDWKLIYYHASGNYELFNITEDIGETTNRFNTETAIARNLADELRQFLIDSDAQMPTFKATGQPVPLPQVP